MEKNITGMIGAGGGHIMSASSENTGPCITNALEKNKKVLIIGVGEVGSIVAERLEAHGHLVEIVEAEEARRIGYLSVEPDPLGFPIHRPIDFHIHKFGQEKKWNGKPCKQHQYKKTKEGFKCICGKPL